MTKPNHAKLQKVKELAKAFKVRYNRNVEVFRALTFNQDNELKEASIHIMSKKGTRFILNEFLSDGLTDYVTITYKVDDTAKTSKYKRYIDAEISVADLIGQEEI